MKLIYPLLALFIVTGCTFTLDLEDTGTNNTPGSSATIPEGEQAEVVRVIDGDTIDVRLDGDVIRVRYVGVNTPERDEACYTEATQANRDLVQNQTVTLVRDESDTDQYGRLLRYIYVGDTFVNEQLIRDGYGEVVSYPPDTAFYEHFRQLEQEASAANVGCHPTGIFDDGNDRR